METLVGLSRPSKESPGSPELLGAGLTSIDPLEQEPPDNVLVNPLDSQGRAAHSKDVPFKLKQLLKPKQVRG